MVFPDDALAIKPHKKGCTGDLYRLAEVVTVDRLGRKGNGGLVAHEYVCNRRWDGCQARVRLLERAVRSLAVAAHASGSAS